MTDTNTLAPCPFCGERAETDFIPEHHSYQIACSDSIGCTARITRDSELGAIEAWNCRAALAAPAQPVATIYATGPRPSFGDAAFELWWADHAPNSAREEAWVEWCALWPSQTAAQQGDAA